jgi:hypothetical protein
LTFDHVTEKAIDGNSGRSKAASIDRERMPAERFRIGRPRTHTADRSLPMAVLSANAP